MQITHIQCELGVYYGTGDFAGVRATVKAHADVERGEDALEAYQKLAAFVHGSLVDGTRNALPDRVKALITGSNGQAQLAAPASNGAAATAAETAKRTRRTKEQIAADEAAKARVNAAAEQLGEPAPDALLEGSEPEDDNLLGDEIPDHPPMTAAECKTIAGQVLKKLGGPSLAKLLTGFGAKDFPSLDAKQYANFAAKARELIGTA